MDSYDFTIQHHPGKFMTVADTLSRTPVNAVTVEGIWTDRKLQLLQQSESDIAVLYHGAENKQ